jgi:hypothetical protein
VQQHGTRPLTRLSKLSPSTEHGRRGKYEERQMTFDSLHRKWFQFMDKQSLPLEDVIKQSASSLSQQTAPPLSYQGRLNNPLRLEVVELVAEDAVAVPLSDACAEW